MMKMYEARNKDKFLKTVNNQDWYEWLFDKSFEFEHRFSKDLYDFNRDELLIFLKAIGDKKMLFSTLKVIRSYISLYVDWAIKSGLKLNKRNPAEDIELQVLQEFAKESNILHVDFIYSMLGIESKIPSIELKNYQDKLLVYLLFIGIRGERATELIDLRYEHVDFENRILKLGEVSPDRSDIKLDDISYYLFKNAKSEQYYYRYMDISNMKTTNIREYYQLIDSDYVFQKTSTRKNSDSVKLSYQGIMRRLHTFSNYVGLDLTMKNIERAGMTYIAYKILEQGMEISVNNPIVVKAIFNRYGIYSNSIRNATITRLRKDVKKIYLDQS